MHPRPETPLPNGRQRIELPPPERLIDLVADNAQLREALALSEGAGARRELITQELKHRIGNLLTVVQAIARKTFAGVLFVVAVCPAALVTCYETALEPVYSLHIAWLRFSNWFAESAWWVVGGPVVLLLLYPPTIPFVRLQAGRVWRQLGTDGGPLFDGLARLRHLETHADHLLVGRMARHLGNHQLAREHLTRAHELDPRHLSGLSDQP